METITIQELEKHRKFIITAEMRELEMRVSTEQISYSRMIELLNEKAENWAKQQIIKAKIEVLRKIEKKCYLKGERTPEIYNELIELQAELKQLENPKI